MPGFKPGDIRLPDGSFITAADFRLQRAAAEAAAAEAAQKASPEELKAAQVAPSSKKTGADKTAINGEE